jgi:hypothetical protein
MALVRWYHSYFIRMDKNDNMKFVKKRLLKETLTDECN